MIADRKFGKKKHRTLPKCINVKLGKKIKRHNREKKI